MNYQYHYDRIIEKYGTREKPIGFYSEKHHIIPKCLGGSDEESNMVHLPAEAHYVAHQLLVKMNPSHYGISYAAMLMTYPTTQQLRGNKLYSWLKARFSERSSVFQKERFKDKTKHPCYGKFGKDHPRSGTGKLQSVPGYTRPEYKKRGSKEYFEMMSAIRKESFKGEKNPAYGTKMINNGVIRKRIPDGTPLPDGWVWGAVLTR